MKFLAIIFVLFFLFSCNSGNNKAVVSQSDESTNVSFKLELVWETDTVLKTPESVLADRERNVIYVSNVNMNPWEEDGNGFISKLDFDGNVIDLKWIDGLDGPKGMGISGNSLFIADINELVEANIETGEIVNRILIEGKPDVNDITTADDGSVYLSGSGSNRIYKLVDGVLKEVYQGGDERLNGLFWEKDRMLMVTSKSSKFKEMSWETKDIKVIAGEIGHGDGIAPVGDGGYIVSSWSGAVFYISAEGKSEKLLDTEAEGINTADIDYIIEKNLLIIPTFYDNRVKTYKLSK